VSNVPDLGYTSRSKAAQKIKHKSNNQASEDYLPCAKPRLNVRLWDALGGSINPRTNPKTAPPTRLPTIFTRSPITMAFVLSLEGSLMSSLFHDVDYAA
jgi:hypothetical protein